MSAAVIHARMALLVRMPSSNIPASVRQVSRDLYAKSVSAICKIDSRGCPRRISERKGTSMQFCMYIGDLLAVSDSKSLKWLLRAI